MSSGIDQDRKQAIYSTTCHNYSLAVQVHTEQEISYHLVFICNRVVINGFETMSCLGMEWEI